MASGLSTNSVPPTTSHQNKKEKIIFLLHPNAYKHTSPHSNQVLCLHCYLLSFSSPTRVTSTGEVAKIVNVFIIILSSHVFICILIIASFLLKTFATLPSQSNRSTENMTAFLEQTILLEVLVGAKKISISFSIL